MKKLILLLTGAAFIASYALADGNAAAISLSKATKTVTIDGVAHTDGTEAWGTTWVDMTAKKTDNKSDEISSKFQLAYNDTYIWLACQQTGNSTMDTDPAVIPTTYQRDCYEVFFSMDTDAYANGGAYGEWAHQFRMQRASIYPWGFDDHGSVFTNNKGATKDTIAQVDAGDGSFVQEWQLTWRSLFAPMVDSGTFDCHYFRFEIQAADNTTGTDGGRTDQVFWKNNSDFEWNNTRTFTVVYLKDKVDTTGVGIKSLKGNSLSVNVSKDRLLFSKYVSGDIYNISGQRLIILKNANSVNISSLKRGVYFIKANGYDTYKFIK